MKTAAIYKRGRKSPYIRMKKIIITTTCPNECYLTKYIVQYTPSKDMLHKGRPMRPKHVA
jgi:hypothetical protein